jgi:primosomal protein N' (replication factor Y)
MASRRAKAASTDPHASPPGLFANADVEDGVRRARVLLPLPLAGAYDYAVPAEMAVQAGAVVEAPLGRRRLPGVVWDVDPADSDVPPERLKHLERRFDVPPIPDVTRRFVIWVANYYLAPPGAVLKMCLSVPAALEPPPATVAYVRGDGDPAALGLRLTPARRRVLGVVAEGPPRPATDLAREAGCSTGVIKGLADAGVLARVSMYPGASAWPADVDRDGPMLSDAQRWAADRLRAKVDMGGFGVTLLDGVTGSGKTEVYLEAVRATLARGRQALVLLPEIALSTQVLERVAARFGAEPAVWHSDLTSAQRRNTWRAVARGEAPVVVGARSALFLPFPDLGLIVVDEEHDPSFKQDEGVPYHARDMAVVRARLGDLPSVLVSATPALESVENVRAGRYDSLHLPRRHAGAALPDTETVDMRAERPPPIAGHGTSYLAPRLRDAVQATLDAGEQAMLFLNRRGYAPLTLCRTCGHRLQCPYCTAWLVEHRLLGRLQCHHCGFTMARPEACPDCGAADSFAACGPGIERVSEEVAALFPSARVSMLASDTVGGPAAAAAFVDSVRNREVDILIGTQIVAKGHHFPDLTLVGVVDADLGLTGGDLRAGERTYQLLHQVAGRAGRAARPGRVLLQTYQPNHEVMQALVAHDRDRFLEVESANRREAGMPPFARLAALVVASQDMAIADDVARELGRTAPRAAGVDVFGPAPAPLAVLRGRYRRRLLLRTRRDVAPQRILRDWLARVHTPNQARLSVDVDPYTFL